MKAVISKLFKTYFNINKVEFIIWDNNSMLLRDFVQDWRVYDNNTASVKINSIYGSLSITNGKNFYFNDEELSCELTEDDQYKILELK